MQSRLQKLNLMRPASLEWQRTCTITAMSPFADSVLPSSQRVYARYQKRLAQIDRVIASKAEAHVAHLLGVHSDYVRRGWHVEAERVALRIASVLAMPADCQAEATEAAAQTEPLLKLAELRRAYSDDVPLLRDMESDLFAAMAA